MSNIVQKPYEISLWDNAVISTETGQVKRNELKLFIIGSDKMLSQNRVLDPVLKENINGQVTLTFKMYYQYKDNHSGKLINNPYIDFLTNERKVKLKYDNKWYEFVIKERVKNSSDKSYSYTAEDAVVYELSKRGFNVSLSNQSQDNTGTVTELAEKVLRNTEWKVNQASDRLLESKIEPAVSITLQITKEKAEFFPLFKTIEINKDGSSAEFLDSASEINTLTETELKSFDLFAPYSCFVNQDPRFQLLAIPKKDSQIKKSYHCWMEADTYQTVEGLFVSVPTTLSAFISTLQMADRDIVKYITIPIGHKEPFLNRYVEQCSYIGAEQDHKPNSLYKYIEREYHAPELIENILPYGSNFAYTEAIPGWRVQHVSKTNKIQTTLSVRNDSVNIQDGKWVPKEITPNYLELKYIYFSSGTDNQLPILYNEDLQYENDKFLPLHIDDRYVVRIKTRSPNLKGQVGLYELGAGESLTGVSELSTLEYISSNKISETTSEYEYKAILLINKNIVSKDTKIVFGFSPASNNIKETLTFQLQEIQLFKYCLSKDGQKEMLPEDSVSTGYTANKYYYYDPNNENNKSAKQLEKKNDIQYYTITDAPLTDYKTDYYETCEKRSSIEVAESNYYNIISQLCDKFKCYATFEVDHIPNTGYINENNANCYQVTFHSYDKINTNPLAIKYSVNLNGITKTQESKNLVSKLIVKNNSNQFAKGGVCSISDAIANPFKDNALYNFDYFYKSNLLNEGEINKILYGQDGTLGYVSNLAKINTSLKQNSDDWNNLSLTLVKLKGQLEYYKEKQRGLEKQKEEKEKFLQDQGLSSEDLKAGVSPISSEEFQKGPDKSLWTVSYASTQAGLDSIVAYYTGSRVYTQDRCETFINPSKLCTLYRYELATQSLDFLKLKKNDLVRMIFNCDNGNKYHTIFRVNSIHPNTTQESVQYFTAYAINYWIEEKGNNSTISNYYFYFLEMPNKEIVYLDGEWKKTAVNGKECWQRKSGLPLNGNPQPLILLHADEIYTKRPTYLLDHKDDNDFSSKIKNTIYELTEIQSNLKIVNEKITTLDQAFKDEQKRYDDLKIIINDEIRDKEDLQKAFETPLKDYIREGTWIDEQYSDSELYYNDAIQVLDNSCRPKVSYTVNVLELSQLEKYKDFAYQVGQKVYIEDEDFFHGNATNRQEVIITELSKNLDDPSKNSLQVQNYFQKKDELFKKITASVQSVTYQKGEYRKGANAISNNTVKNAFLTESLEKNTNEIQNIADQSVNWGDFGITVSGREDPGVLRLTSAGLLISNDKGKSWQTALNSKGLDASIINAGTVNTKNLTIMSSNKPSFFWDDKGITAYENNGVINTNKGVCYNQYGIYGYNSKRPGWYPSDSASVLNSPETTFALTQDGFKLSTEDSFIKFDNNGLIVKENSQTASPIFEVSTETKAVSLAGWNVTSDSLSKDGVGFTTEKAKEGSSIRIYAGSTDPKAALFQVKDNGSLYATLGHIGGWTIGKDSLSQEIDTIWLDDSPAQLKHQGLAGMSKNYPFFAGSHSPKGDEFNTFQVDRNGKLKATGADISGYINASSGQIGNFTISKQGNLSLTKEFSTSDVYENSLIISATDANNEDLAVKTAYSASKILINSMNYDVNNEYYPYAECKSIFSSNGLQLRYYNKLQKQAKAVEFFIDRDGFYTSASGEGRHKTFTGTLTIEANERTVLKFVNGLLIDTSKAQ